MSTGRMNNLMQRFKNFFISTKNKMLNIILVTTEDSPKQLLPLFGLIAGLTFIPFYFINLHLSPDSYENLGLRIIVTLLAIPLLFKNYWPEKFKKFLPFYWYTTLLYTLPFFFLFMTLKNNLSVVWQMNMIQLILLFALLVDWVSFIFLGFFGFLLAYLAYIITTPSEMILKWHYNGWLVVFILNATIYLLYSRKRQKTIDEKLSTMRVLAATLAHELRTPLASIRSGAQGAKKYCPLLLEGYLAAKEQNIPVPFIQPQHYQSLATVLDNIEEEANYSNNVIDMMLMNAQQNQFKIKNFQVCTIGDCISEAMRRYPFQPDQKELIQWNNSVNFEFRGEPMFMVHVLFNLIKNALYYITAENKGGIQIWCEAHPKHNSLYFKDTAKGISADVLPHLFEHFYSETHHGTGLGLAFCKKVIQSFGGDILCTSTLNEFTQFELLFPKIT